MNIFIIALLSVIISVIAQFLLKNGVTNLDAKLNGLTAFSFDGARSIITSTSILAGFFFYGLGAVLWLSVLAKWDVSKAYPLVGLGFVLTAVVGTLMGEQVTVSRMVGIVLICAGVWVVASS